MNNKSNNYIRFNDSVKGYKTLIQNSLDTNNNYANMDIDSLFRRVFMRIQSIELWNFRNIKHGKIVFPNCKIEEIYDLKPSVLGLYGQNGSGKTSVIMAISILKDLLSGRPLSNKYESCIRYNQEKCSLSFELAQGLLNSEQEDFSFSYDNKIYYSFDIIKTTNTSEDGLPETKLHVINELLSVKFSDGFGNGMKSKLKLFDARPSESDDKGRPFGNKIRFERIVGKDIDITNKLRDAKAVAYDRSTSFIFSNKTAMALNAHNVLTSGNVLEELSTLNNALTESQNFINLIPEELRMLMFDNESSDEKIEAYFNDYEKNHTEEQIEQFMEILEIAGKKYDEMNSYYKKSSIISDRFLFFTIIYLLSHFGKHYLFTIDTTSTGLVNVNEQWPILLWFLDAKRGPHTTRVYLSMDESSKIREKDYSSMKASLSGVSKVLNAVVPGLSLEIVDLGKQIAKDGRTQECVFEIMSCREDNSIPLRYESDGVRRLVSILSLLIAAYNQPFFTIAIDEIDSGIFEYLLGEILKILSISAKGQIVFTSHNLRPLEVMPPKFLCFTTTNPEKKFVRLQNRGNSNFRDGYFRNIVLGTSDDSIYSPTDQFEIEIAFYEAGLERGEKYE